MSSRRLTFLWFLIGAAAWPGPAVAAETAKEGYEAVALARALAERGLVVDPAPNGKRLAHIHVVSQEVFDQNDWYLQLANVFHRTTRESVIAREVLLRPGDVWNAEIAAETRRNLLDDSPVNLVVVVPVRHADPGRVDMLVVVRDTWSLRLNSNFEYQDNALTFLQLQPSEMNLFGLKKQLALVFDMNLGRYSIGPAYYDGNIVGSRWTLSASARALIARDTGETEGSTSSLSMSYPLWSLRREWAAGFSFGHSDGVARRFSGASPCIYSGNPNECDPDPSRGVAVRYRSRSVGGGWSVTRQFGHAVKNRVSFGYGFSVSRREIFASDFTAFPELIPSFIDGILPRSEHTSSLRVSYGLFVPRYITLRDVGTFDFTEDVRVGPDIDLYASWSIPALGSSREFWGLGASASYTFELPRQSLFYLGAGAGSRVQNGDLIDNSFSSSVRFVSPKIVRAGRVIVAAEAARLIDNRATRSLSVGGDSGLRGYPLGAFVGQALARGNVELRSVGWPVWFSRVGVVLFWDVGHAAASFDEMRLHHDLGAGARILIPQAQRTVIRLDWAFATRDIVTSTGGTFNTAGWPGRFSAGFTQAF